MLLMSQRNVGMYGAQPVDNQETLEAVGIRVKSNLKRLSLTLGVTVQYKQPLASCFTCSNCVYCF